MNLLAKFLVGAAAWEGSLAMLRFADRRKKYAIASARARQLGKPLVVIGDPDSGSHTRFMRAYGCGDLCLDLNGCPKCPNQWAVDITKQIPVQTGSAVVFVSCVLEYVNDLPAAWKELRRIAGEELYVTTVQPWSFTGKFFPGAKWTLTPSGSGFVAKRISYDPRDGSRGDLLR